MTPEFLPLSRWPAVLKTLALAFVASLCLGYAAAVVNIHDKATDSGARPFSLDGVVTRYRGEGWSGAAAGEGPMSYTHLVDLTHVHGLSMPILFFLLGSVFVFSSCPEGVKRLLVITSFTDLWLNIGSLWAIRYSGSPRLWAGMLFLSGIVMGTCFAAMAFFAARDLLRRPAA